MVFSVFGKKRTSFPHSVLQPHPLWPEKTRQALPYTGHTFEGEKFGLYLTETNLELVDCIVNEKRIDSLDESIRQEHFSE